MVKSCPDGKILNPKTNRCVNKDGKIGKNLVDKVNRSKSPSKKTSPVKSNDHHDKTCPDGTILNPKTKRCVKVSGAIGKKILASQKNPNSFPIFEEEPKKIPKENNSDDLEKVISDLYKRQLDAMRSRNIPLWKQLGIEIEEAKKKKSKNDDNSLVPTFLNVCKSNDGQLLKLPTIDGDKNIIDVIKNEKQLIIHDNMCYDIVSLIELIKADISQGNVWGLNPYVKQEGLILPFEREFKDTLLTLAKKKQLVPQTMKWEDRSPKSAKDVELRGQCTVSYKKTPTSWLKKGWASDGTRFPTKTYISIFFSFPRLKCAQQPGKTIILPDNEEAEDFMYLQLLPVYLEGALWSKKISVSTGILVLNPNVHFTFEDNRPERWYADKISNLKGEMLKFAPGFLTSRKDFNTSCIIINDHSKTLQEYNSIQLKDTTKNQYTCTEYRGSAGSTILNISIIEFIMLGLPIYSSILTRALHIIQGFMVGPHNKEIKVYHGTQTAIHNPKTKVVTCTTFMSTSMDKQTSLHYAYGGCLYEIVIPPNFPIVNCFDILLQILLPIGMELSIVETLRLERGQTLYRCNIVNVATMKDTINNLYNIFTNQCQFDLNFPKIQKNTMFDISKSYITHRGNDIDIIAIDDPLQIYVKRQPSYIKIADPIFFKCTHLSNEYYLHPIHCQIVNIDEGNILTESYLLSRAVNTVLCNIIYNFYQVPSVESSIFIHNYKEQHMKVMMMTQTKNYKASKTYNYYIQSFLVDCIACNMDIYEPFHTVLVESKHLRFHMGQCLAFSGNAEKRINVSFFVNDNPSELLNKIKDNAHMIRKYFNVMKSFMNTNKDNEEQCYAILNATDVSKLKTLPSILRLKKDMDDINMGTLMNPIIDDIIKRVEQRHIYLMNNKEATIKAMKMILHGGSKHDSKPGSHDDEIETMVSRDFFKKMIAQRMNVVCKKS